MQVYKGILPIEVYQRVRPLVNLMTSKEEVMNSPEFLVVIIVLLCLIITKAY